MDPLDLRLWKEFQEAGGSLANPAMTDQIVIDSRRIDTGQALFVALKGEHQDGHNYVAHAAKNGAKWALVAHEWTPPSTLPPISLLRVANPLKSLQELAKLHRERNGAKVIGICGSFGKTMAKDLLSLFLGTTKSVVASPESFNSQIGVALSLLKIKSHHELAIIEAAISQENEMDALVHMIRPDYTLLTPLGKKHLATLQNLATLNKEILKFVMSTQPSGWSLTPEANANSLSDQPFQKYLWDIQCDDLPHAKFSKEHPDSHYSIAFPDGERYTGEVRGGHTYFLNLINMTAKAGWLLGASSSHMISVLRDFRTSAMRTEMWKSAIGSTIINDVYCSDPQSVDLALRYFDTSLSENRKVFVFGGMRDGDNASQTDYKRIGTALAHTSVDHLILVGNHPFKPLFEEVSHSSPTTEISVFENYEEALPYLCRSATSKDQILFKGDKKFELDTLALHFNESLFHNQCVVNLAAMKDNLALIRKHLTAGTRVMMVVKALAYGTNDVHISKFMEKNGVDILGVSYIDEAVNLKRMGVSQAIFSLNATPYEAAKAVKWGIEVGVSDAELIDALAKEADLAQTRVKVHLHVNTGMGRFGCRSEEALSLAKRIQSHPTLVFEGIMTHFASADNPEHDSFTLEQIACFDRVIATIEETGISIKWKHAANSSGAIRFSLPQYNMVRLGIAVYGLYASLAVKEALDLRLALSLTSRIVGINTCVSGESISYGRTYLVQEDSSRIAVLPIGYFDGLHRHYSGKAHVLINGQKAPMVGNICMDYMMVNVTDIPSAKVGDPVLIFGENEFGDYLAPEELAEQGGSIIHELMTCLGPRIPRIFIYEEGNRVR